jgi:hypothetical protein
MNKDRKLIEEATKIMLLDIIKESKILKKKLSLSQIIEMGRFVTQLPYQESVRILLGLDKITTEQVKKYESKTKRNAKYAATGIAGGTALRYAHGVRTGQALFKDARPEDSRAAKRAKWLKKVENPVMPDAPKLKNVARTKGVVGKVKAAGSNLSKTAAHNVEVGAKTVGKKWAPKSAFGAGVKGAATAMGALYLYRKLSDPCERKFFDKAGKIACKKAAISKVISQLNTQLRSCGNTSNPQKCVAKYRKDITTWQNRLRELNG